MRRALLGHGFAVLGHRHPHLRHHRGRLFPGHDSSARILHLHRVHVLGRERGDEVDLARLEGSHLGDGILDHADHDAIEIGPSRFEVLFEAIHHQVIALHPLDQPEWSASRHRLGLAHLSLFEGVRLRRDRVVDHEAGAVGGQHVQEERVGVFQAHLDSRGVDHLDALDGLEERSHARLRLRVPDAVDAELHGGGVHRCTVVEEDVLPELEGVEPAVGRGLPGLGGVGNELPVGRDVDEATSDVHGDPHHFVAGGRVEVEVRDLVAVGDAQNAAALGRLGFGGERRNGDHPGERGHPQEEPWQKAS